MPYCKPCSEAGHMNCSDFVRCGNVKPTPRKKRKPKSCKVCGGTGLVNAADDVLICGHCR